MSEADDAGLRSSVVRLTGLPNNPVGDVVVMIRPATGPSALAVHASVAAKCEGPNVPLEHADHVVPFRFDMLVSIRSRRMPAAHEHIEPTERPSAVITPRRLERAHVVPVGDRFAPKA